MKQAAATAVIPTAPSGRTIGEILLSRSLVTDAELDDAIAIQRETGKPLGQVLVEAGTITRLELASALAEQWGDVGTISPTFPGGSAYVDPAELDGNPSTQLEELRRTRRALEERMLAFERNAEDAQWQQEIAAGVRALFGRVDVLEATLGEFTESGLINELRQLVVELAQRTETMAPELETLRARIDGTASRCGAAVRPRRRSPSGSRSPTDDPRRSQGGSTRSPPVSPPPSTSCVGRPRPPARRTRSSRPASTARCRPERSTRSERPSTSFERPSPRLRSGPRSILG